MYQGKLTPTDAVEASIEARNPGAYRRSTNAMSWKVLLGNWLQDRGRRLYVSAHAESVAAVVVWSGEIEAGGVMFSERNRPGTAARLSLARWTWSQPRLSGWWGCLLSLGMTFEPSTCDLGYPPLSGTRSPMW